MAIVLVIDDDPLVRKSIVRVLRAAGHEPIEAEDGRAGLDALGRQTVDLVITDIIMPRHEGIETIAEIREICSVPIIAMSGSPRSPSSDVLLDAQLMGADAVLPKPFTTEELMAAMTPLLLPSHAASPTRIQP